MPAKTRHPDDVAIGVRIKAARARAGVSQERLGEACDVTFQQIQKYENGVNRVSGARLIQISQALRVSVADLTGQGTGADALTEIGGLSRAALRAAAAIDSLPADVGRSLADLVETIAAASGLTLTNAGSLGVDLERAAAE